MGLDKDECGTLISKLIGQSNKDRKSRIEFSRLTLLEIRSNLAVKRQKSLCGTKKCIEKQLKSCKDINEIFLIFLKIWSTTKLPILGS